MTTIIPPDGHLLGRQPFRAQCRCAVHTEFRKYSQPDQALYIVAAVSTLAYSYAANGDTARGRCIQNWYFGQKGGSDIPARIASYESIDPDKYHVEGVIMGVADKVCADQAKPKQ